MNNFPFCGALAITLLVALPLAALAAEPSPPIGSEARAWLELQQSGRQASTAPRPMPGEIADNVYQRYLDSFKLPIPAEFRRQSASDAGNGSGQ